MWIREIEREYNRGKRIRSKLKGKKKKIMVREREYYNETNLEWLLTTLKQCKKMT